jgi:RNA polymerase sigma-70 factor, ECF subfamily
MQMKTFMEPSAALIEECKKGNQQAFKELFYNYRSYAYNLIYKICGANADHEDLLQELFFQIYLSLKTFKGNSSFSTWFYRVVFHVCSGKWRYQQAKKRISAEDTVEYESVEYCVSNHQFEPGYQMELKEMVNAALETLTDTLRIPLVLNVYSDLDVTKIAEILGLPVGTVKSRLFSARMKVKKYLDSVNVDNQ